MFRRWIVAGEWIPIDCNLGTKPEVLEVAAATHEPIEVVYWMPIPILPNE